MSRRTHQMRIQLAIILMTTVVGLGPMPSQASGPPADEQGQTSAVPAAPKRFAFLVGINHYLHVPELKGSERDVETMQEILHTKFGFPRENMLQLLSRQASHEAIVEGFRKQLIDNARKHPNAIVVFYYSGHGSQVEDQNGDEGDGWDETIVPYNSRDPEGKNFDITDDALNELFEELSRHTQNITFIFDSCHSGSVTRAGAEVRARMVDPDKRPRQPKQKPLPAASGGARNIDLKTVDLLPPNQRYVTISGSASNESSYEKEIEPGRPNGYLTYHLVKLLNSNSVRPETTYRELMEKVASAVTAESPNQHPQWEGGVGRQVFGGTATHEDPFIKIAKVDGNKVRIKAGKAQGIQEGAFIAIYASSATELKGDRDKLVNATVTQVEAFEATAELPADSPKLKDVTPNAKAVLVSPAIKPLRVAFEGPQARLYTGSDGGVLAAIRAQLKSNDNKTIELIESAPGEVFVARGKFGQVFTNARDTELAAKDTETKLPQSGDEVYYLHVGDHVPMFGFFVKADDRQGGQKIANAFEKYARQRNLLALSNSVSPLNEGIEVSVLVVFGENTPDGFKEKSRELVKPREGQTSYTFDQDVYFRIQVENRTGKDVYVTVMNISTDGSINILYPPPGARDKLVAGKSVVTPLYVTTAPAGVEAYKVIATSTYTDFSFLEQVGVKNRNPISQLETLLNDTTAQKRSVPVKEVTLDDWGTREVKFLVSRNKRN